MDLMGQLVGYRFSQERCQQKVLHRVQGRGLVQDALVVVLLLEDVSSVARWWNG